MTSMTVAHLGPFLWSGRHRSVQQTTAPS